MSWLVPKSKNFIKLWLSDLSFLSLYFSDFIYIFSFLIKIYLLKRRAKFGVNLVIEPGFVIPHSSFYVKNYSSKISFCEYIFKGLQFKKENQWWLNWVEIWNLGLSWDMSAHKSICENPIVSNFAKKKKKLYICMFTSFLAFS